MVELESSVLPDVASSDAAANVPLPESELTVLDALLAAAPLPAVDETRTLSPLGLQFSTANSAPAVAHLQRPMAAMVIIAVVCLATMTI